MQIQQRQFDVKWERKGSSLGKRAEDRGTQRQFLDNSVRKTIWDLEFSEHLL